MNVKEFKYLGLAITHDLRWDTHIDNVSSKANKALWALRRNLRYATTDIKSLAYKTLIRPILEYAKVVWDPYTQSNKIKLDRVQRLASRFIFNKYQRCHSPSELCKRADLSSLEVRCSFERLKCLYEIIHHKIKINHEQYFEIKHNETSRHRHSMYIPAPFARNN